MFTTVRNSLLLQIKKYGQRRYIRYSLDSFSNNLNRRQAEESSTIVCQSCGQPTAITHPHLMKEGEVIPDYESRMNGAEFLAYPPVIAAGKNSNVIHYISNNQIIQNGEMVLMDAGCEYHGYSSDVTRTWPINGTFTQEQKIVYDVVLDVQKTLIRQLKEFPSLDQLYHDMCSLLSKRLQEIRLIPKDLSRTELFSAVHTYCPHHVSHYLGMDIHDTGKMSRNLKLQPGMIITVEPGIYINHKNKFAPPEFYGLGVRIEDDILITENGPVILTETCPKEINEIEALASQNL
ncbi:xaa-Pro aminopeptidase 3 isoform X2 [Osmia lignaria lignaria]|uniref:xaa-Pro aminopeptidase 3 isoform X2 n=1 Tax=Osmia lignaria lignaria TaxID=1437193 RepID=UPI00402B2F35